MKKVYYHKFSLYTKINDKTTYQRHREIILNRVKEYYNNNEERLRD